MNPAVRRRLNLLGLCIAIGLVLAAVENVGMYVRPWRYEFEVSFWSGLSRLLIPWMALAVLAFFIAELCRRFPIVRGSLRISVPVHVVASLALPFLHMLAVAYLNALIFGANDTFITRFRTLIAAYPPLGLLAYWAVVGVVHSVLFSQRALERERQAAQLDAQLANATLDALRAQLNPHFLFNTLNTVSMLVRDAKRDDAVNMIARLSTLLRHLIDGDARQEIPLREELALVREYLAIERERFHDRLVIVEQVAPELEDALVPPLMLQPLAENAIRHGLARKQGRGTLTLAAAANNGALVLEVRDDGLGIAGPEGSGVGLRNTRDRLHALYGTTGRLELLDGQPGAIARVTIPMKPSGDPRSGR